MKGGGRERVGGARICTFGVAAFGVAAFGVIRVLSGSATRSESIAGAGARPSAGAPRSHAAERS